MPFVQKSNTKQQKSNHRLPPGGNANPPPPPNEGLIGGIRLLQPPPDFPRSLGNTLSKIYRTHEPRKWRFQPELMAVEGWESMRMSISTAFAEICLQLRAGGDGDHAWNDLGWEWWWRIYCKLKTDITIFLILLKLIMLEDSFVFITEDILGDNILVLN